MSSSSTPLNTLSTTACHRCRGQKLRCTREQPTCQRCERLGAFCSYPAPPDRKRLAEERTHASTSGPSKSSRTRSNIGHAASPLLYGASSAANSPTLLPGGPESVPQSDEIQLSTVSQRLLIDVYFDYFPEASLVFHRATFLQNWADGHVPAHNLRAIYAMATIYLGPNSTASGEDTGQLSWMGDLRPFGLQWATRAGKEVLSDADQPTLASARTCLILVLYWFAIGDPQRNTVFSGLAYRAVRSMAWQYNASANTFAVAGRSSSPSSASSRTDPAAWLNGEQFRRCFWFAWLGNCLNADHYVGGMSTDSLVLNMPLPIGDISFDHGVQAPSLRLSDYANPRDVDIFARTATDASLLAQLVRAIWGWSKARDLIESRSQLTTSEYSSQLSTLDDALRTWEMELPPSLTYSRAILEQQVGQQKRYNYCLMMAAFYQSRLVIHLSMIPFFTGTPAPDGNSVGAIRVSTRRALEVASSLLNLAVDLQTVDQDFSRLTPFFGYCMYSAAAVRIAFCFAAGISVERFGNISAALDILTVMKNHWAGLKGLWSRITTYYDEIASLHARQPNSQMSFPSSTSDQLAAFDNRASSPTGAGHLSGLLGDFLLKNSLRQVHDTYATSTEPAEAPTFEDLGFLDIEFGDQDLQAFQLG